MKNNAVQQAKNRLIDSAGRTTQDFGMGRIVGQVMAVLYLTEGESSLDYIGKELGLSKAAVSIATRQLESLGLVQRVWLSGDKRSYYRTVENFAVALQHGILEMVRNKLRAGENDLDYVDECLKNAEDSPEGDYLKNRIKRARYLKKRASAIINNPLLKLLSRKK